ncbi:MAG: diguanylate cyclase [Rhodospirillales bacterium]|nr:diguanylate cyclase [Rhodospirillales bacterium]
MTIARTGQQGGAALAGFAEQESSDPLRGALLDSRQRWRDLVGMAADLAFETDEHGRLTFIMPDPVLGWSAATLLGQPAELLLAEAATGVGAAGFNPFLVAAPMRRRRVWLKRADGSVACLSFAAAPLFDPAGRIVGARGIGLDVTEQDSQEAQVAATLRRGEVIDHILWRMRQEVLAPRMMRSALEALLNAMGAEGAAVIHLPPPEPAGQPPAIAHQAGGAAQMVLGTAAVLLRSATDAPVQACGADGRPVLVCCCQTRFGAQAGLALWRSPGGRAWDGDDFALAASATGIIRVVLEHEAIQREMNRQARTDPLTGLLNRRAFLDEMARHIDRLDREEQPGTLIFADLDHFKPVNDRLGHEVGDQVLCRLAAILRDAVRPTDLVARLGGDEFAIWMNGADHLTAAERAEGLRVSVPRELAKLVEGGGKPLSLSMGIATRRTGGAEAIDSLINRADLAMYEVKRAGRAHWRVSQEEPPQHPLGEAEPPATP